MRPCAGGADRLYDAVAEVLENVAAVRPVVLVIEDLHWVDPQSLGLLRFLVRVIEDARVLIVLTFRSDELGRGSALRAWLPELDRNRRVTRLELARLDRRQVREMATAILDGPPDEDELAQVYLRTDGVPFFVEELVCCSGVRSLDSFPDTLRDILLARYEQLSEPTQRMLRLIAAGGVRVEHELLVAVCDESPEAIDVAASEAIAASVLVVDGTAYAFRHALVREAIHDQLLPGERVRFHTRYAQALRRAVRNRRRRRDRDLVSLDGGAQRARGLHRVDRRLPAGEVFVRTRHRRHHGRTGDRAVGPGARRERARRAHQSRAARATPLTCCATPARASGRSR